MNEMIKILEQMAETGAGAVGNLVGNSEGKMASSSVAMASKVLNKLLAKGEGFFNDMLKDFKGEVPSLLNAIQSLSPADIIVAAQGGSVPLFDNMKCTEGFGYPKLRPKVRSTIYQLLLVCLIVIVVIVVLKFFGSSNT